MADLTPRAQELNRLATYPDIPYEKGRPSGVLLSDEIDYYARRFRMIDPYDPPKLKPAGYELSVGTLYCMKGDYFDLTTGGSITIEPFEVVVIQTLETLNLPQFMIARWNVRTRWAYEGLLWVGAAQVDAGFRGYLSCPLYNLSDKPVSIDFGERIAVIDFVTTTAPTRYSLLYDWRDRSRVTFREYKPHTLKSAIVTRVLTDLEKIKNDLVRTTAESIKAQEANRNLVKAETSAVQSRVDNFVSITFTLIAVLFAALGLAAARSIESSFWSSSIWLSAIALWFAMRAFVLTKSRLQVLSQQSAHPGMSDLTRVPLWFEVGAALTLAGALIGSNYLESRKTTSTILDLKNQIAKSSEASQKELSKSQDKTELELQNLHSENDRLRNRMEALQSSFESRTSKKIP